MQETQPLKQVVLGFCGFGANSGQLAVLGSLHFFPAELHKISKAPFFGAGKAGHSVAKTFSLKSATFWDLFSKKCQFGGAF